MYISSASILMLGFMFYIYPMLVYFQVCIATETQNSNFQRKAKLDCVSRAVSTFEPKLQFMSCGLKFIKVQCRWLNRKDVLHIFWKLEAITLIKLFQICDHLNLTVVETPGTSSTGHVDGYCCNTSNCNSQPLPEPGT